MREAWLKGRMRLGGVYMRKEEGEEDPVESLRIESSAGSAAERPHFPLRRLAVCCRCAGASFSLAQVLGLLCCTLCD